MTDAQERRPRARRHQVYAGAVAGYLLAALVVVAVDAAPTRPRWLALHLLGLGAATNAVFVWSRHFAQAMLHARAASERGANTRLAALNVAVISVVLGVTTELSWLAVAGAFAVAAVVAWHGASLVTMARGHRVMGPLRPVVGFYVASAACLVAGAGFGAVLAGEWLPDDSSSQQRLHLAHAQLNLLGWLGLTVIGTLFVLWPATLRTRMPAQTTRLVPWTLAASVAGLVLLVSGILAGSTDIAVAGGAGYAVGVLLAAVPMVLSLPGQRSRTSSAWWLGASVCWLLAADLVDVARIANHDSADQVLHPVVPMLALGLVAQALVGALTFLLPVTVGGGPTGNRRMLATLQLGWVPRVALTDAGLVLAVAPGPRPLHLAGWVMTLSGLGSFLPLLSVAMGRRPRMSPSADAGTSHQ